MGRMAYGHCAGVGASVPSRRPMPLVSRIGLGELRHLRRSPTRSGGTCMSRNRWSPVLVAGLLVSACFHQIVQTGRTPGPTVVEKPWVSTWIFGLVAAQPIDVRQQCPNGVATVDTQESFANGLVGALTLGIYTPQSVKITCAAAG